MTSPDVIALMTATGWHLARVLVDSGGELEVEPVAGFALVRTEKGGTAIAPLLVGGATLYVPGDDLHNAMRLVGPGERPVARQARNDGWYVDTEPGVCAPGVIPSAMNGDSR